MTSELFFVGAEATVKKSFPITHTRKSKQAVANLAQGSRIQVLAAVQADDKGVYYHYLVKSASGRSTGATRVTSWKITEGCLGRPEKAEDRAR